MTREQWLELHLRDLMDDCQIELDRRRHPGGMQAGTPEMAGWPLSALTELRQRALNALNATEAWYGDKEPWRRRGT